MSFRGSRTVDTWIANLDFGKDGVDDLCSGCEVHGGFWKSWQVVADTLTSGVKSALETYPGFTVVFTGHSFGAALATLGAVQLRNAGYSIEHVSRLVAVALRVQRLHTNGSVVWIWKPASWQ